VGAKVPFVLAVFGVLWVSAFAQATWLGVIGGAFFSSSDCTVARASTFSAAAWASTVHQACVPLTYCYCNGAFVLRAVTAHGRCVSELEALFSRD
jgi:hypothetical protein